jgi:beta-glucosidase
LLACGGGGDGAKVLEDPADTRATALVAAMTLDEKILLVHGAGFPALVGDAASGTIPGIPRLGIPGIRWAWRPRGIRR